MNEGQGHRTGNGHIDPYSWTIFTRDPAWPGGKALSW